MTSTIAGHTRSHPSTADSSSIQLRSFQPADADAFRILNEEWISHYFSLENEDRMLLGDPQTHILARGGYIFVAESNGIVVGCCALIPVEPGHMLLGKMAVSPNQRNLGIGRRLLQHTIDRARLLGLTRITLETSSQLTNAIHLYSSLGFSQVPPERVIPSQLSRADVYMEIYL